MSMMFINQDDDRLSELTIIGPRRMWYEISHLVFLRWLYENYEGEL